MKGSVRANNFGEAEAFLVNSEMDWYRLCTDVGEEPERFVNMRFYFKLTGQAISSSFARYSMVMEKSGLS